jgi:hypothetical protein
MQPEAIPSAKPAPMAHTLAACSRNDDGSRLRAVTHRRPSGRSRPTRTDPSTITSPTIRSRTQISPGVRGGIAPPPDQPSRNRPPPARGKREALLQINHHGPRSGPDFPAESGDDRTRTGACSPDKRVLLAAELRPLDSAGGIRTHDLELMRLAGTASPLRRESARLESNQRSPAPKAGGVADLPYRQMIKR